MLSNPSRTAASTASCTGKPPLVGIVRCSNKSNQFTTSIEELERQLSHLGAGTSGLAQAAAHGVLKHSRSPPTPLVPPLRRPAAPPVDLQGVHAETASVARGASPIQLAQLAQQLRMRVRAVQDLVERCPQLLTLSPWQLDAAVLGLASELGISSARALFMVSKDPYLLFMGRAGAPLQEGCICEGSSRSSTTDVGYSTSSTSSSSSSSGSKSRQGSKLSCSSSHSGPWAATMSSSAEPASRTGSKGPAGGTSPSSSVSASGAHAPNASPAMRAATLAQALGVQQEEVVYLAASAPSVLSRPPGPLAAKLRRLGEVLEGVPMARVLRMASEEPSYLSYRPPSIDRRIQAMHLLFRKPRHKIVHMLTRQPDLVFMSPRILHNKLKVLQRIFNKEPRLVIPIIMRTPKLLRTDMDKVRECYELLEGLMGLPSRSYTFAMVCHAPALLLEGKSRLVGRFRCISHAIRGAPHWAKQWRKLYPAQRADCMLVTPVTYSRLEFLLTTGQARSMHMYDALMMARSDFSQRFPTFRPVPIRRPTPAPHAAPATPAYPPATLFAPAPGGRHDSASNAPHLAQGSQHTTTPVASVPSLTRGSTPSNESFTLGMPASAPHFDAPPVAGAPAARATAPSAVPAYAGGAAAMAVSAAAAAAASKKAGAGSAQPPPSPPWTPAGTLSHVSPVLPSTAPLPVATTPPAYSASNGASSQPLPHSRLQQQQQQQQLQDHQQHVQQHAAPSPSGGLPHHLHTHRRHHLHSTHRQQQQQHHQGGQPLPQPLSMQEPSRQVPSMHAPSGLQGHLEVQRGGDMKLVGHRGSRRMRHHEQQQQQQQLQASFPQQGQCVAHHTDLLPHLPPHPQLVASQPGVASSHAIPASDLLPLASHSPPQPAASTSQIPSQALSQVPTHTATQTAAHLATQLPEPETGNIQATAHLATSTAEQATAHLATQLPEPEVAAVQGQAHLHGPANGTAVHEHQGEVIQGLAGRWQNPRPLQPTLEFSTVAYAVRHQLQGQGQHEPQHVYPSGGKDAHELSQLEGRRTGSSWGSMAGSEHGSSTEGGGITSNGVHHRRESGRRRESRRAGLNCRQGRAESKDVLSEHHHHGSKPQHAAPLPLAAAQH